MVWICQTIVHLMWEQQVHLFRAWNTLLLLFLTAHAYLKLWSWFNHRAHVYWKFADIAKWAALLAMYASTWLWHTDRKFLSLYLTWLAEIDLLRMLYRCQNGIRANHFQRYFRPCRDRSWDEAFPAPDGEWEKHKSMWPEVQEIAPKRLCSSMNKL